jgi:amino acid transporter/mannitol/fructose-specific phosphotransferase system IIA component (Ntr-type)
MGWLVYGVINESFTSMSTHTRLEKELGLMDVFAISTGAMFSSGFFLLPGIASAYAGPAVILAYFLAGVLVVPAMLSKAELATAMPKAGGTYYFIDRSMGPLMGTIGGIGTWFSLIFKSAFALIGIGAYLVFFVDYPIKPIAIILTIVFAIVNIVGAKETSQVQRILVITLLTILTFFVVQGLHEIFSLGIGTVHTQQFVPFSPFGSAGVLATIGMVFVSYGGLTKVASVAEEVKNPTRNIPLGMGLSLAVVTFFYVAGVYVMVGVLDPVELRSDLTPVATAAESFLDWLPGSIGLMLVVVAAIAAFASTGNAGIMSASRYPLAMARDRLMWGRFANLGRFNTPDLAIGFTAALMICFIILLDEEGVVKLASAFKLMIFGLINAAVIVMRESKIPSYVPGFRSPWYPWMQIFGVITSIVLIATMGLLPILFTVGIVIGAGAWYFYYGQKRTPRDGAIYHLFERLGRKRDENLDQELRGILKERGVEQEEVYEQTVARARVLDMDRVDSYEDVIEQASRTLADMLDLPVEDLTEGFLEGRRFGATPVTHGVALPHLQRSEISRPALVCVRSQSGLYIPLEEIEQEAQSQSPVYAFFFLVSPKDEPGQHLQMLAELARRIDEPDFMEGWQAADDEHALKETLLHHERYRTLWLERGTSTEKMIGKQICDLELPADTLVAFVRRNGRMIIPRGDTQLQVGDRVTVIGHPEAIEQL